MNKVKYGLSEVHIAFMTDEGWDTPISIPGAVNLELDAAGDKSEFYADNKPYFTQSKNNGYTGSLEVALFPDAVVAKITGSYVDANGKIVEDADGKPEKFALMAQVEGDEKARRIVWYEGEGARPSTSAATTESSITPQTDSIDVTFVPHKFDEIGKNVVKSYCYVGDTEYDDFFKSVVAPKAEEEEEVQVQSIFED